MPPPPAALPAGVPARASRWPGRVREFLLWSWAGRLFAAALAVYLLGQAGAPMPCGIDVLARVVLFLHAGWWAFRLGRWLVRRLLWRIRTKLLVSYLFIAVVPLALLGLLFAVATVLFASLVASHVVNADVEKKAETLRGVAVAALAAADRVAGPAEAERILDPARAVHPDVGWTVVRGGRVVASRGKEIGTLPDWVPSPSFAGLVVTEEAGERLRAIARRDGAHVVLDAPVDARLFEDLKGALGIQFVSSGGDVEVQKGRRGVKVDVSRAGGRGGQSAEPGAGPAGQPFVATPAHRFWADGRTELDALIFVFEPLGLVRKLSGSTLNAVLLTALGIVAGVFLAVYAVALLVGAFLARSITRSVHELHRGTLRLREGDFTQPIQVFSRDQLGDLAESFNQMSESIRELLHEQAEKERLEEELRIARQIQMSLLPQGTVTLPGLRVAALCLPAAEVGGDYYDLLPLSATRMGVLVADVSGKGTSAALYMAELKGLVLSLSRIYDSPARLLGEANRILAGAMDSRTFITMTYAVVDVEAGVMRFARAGHTSLIRLRADSGRTEVFMPQGLGLGIDRGERFEGILEESQVPLRPGDVFLFFTDGLSEAMNPGAELFGEERLRAILEREGPAPDPAALKERILDEIRAFVGDAAPHDDMTMVILRVM